MKKLCCLFCCVAIAAIHLTARQAGTHGFAGDRFFPPTITTDDPFAVDEFAFPTVSAFKNPASGGSPSNIETDAGFEFDEEIFPDFALGVSNRYIDEPRHAPGSYGWDNSTLTAKYESPIVAPKGFSLDGPVISQDIRKYLSEQPIYACACGCGIFEVGTASMLPQGAGGMLFLEYDYQNQNINWSGVKPAPGSANNDKAIRTDFVTLGLEYFFDRSWGVEVEVPYDNRFFKTTGGASGNDVVSVEWSGFSDVRILGLYAGFFEDQSLGVSFGAKLPTGNYRHEDRYHDVDRDSQLGTGDVDLLAGGFFRHQINDSITGFAQVLIDAPIDEVDQYRPGLEADGALGVYATGLKIGGLRVTPVAQVLVSERGHDSGIHSAHPLASGYQRVLLSPGLEFDLHPVTIYADIEVPVYQHFTGEQITAPFLFKVIMSYHF